MGTVWCRSWRVIQLQAWSLLAALTHHCLSYNKMSMSYLLPTLLCLPSILGQSADYDPLYLGKFSDLAHSVGGDIFVLDEKTIYIQDFSHDGQAPDVFFWADGVIVPYITRSNLEPQIGLKRFLPREDVVLLLPPEKPTIHHIERLEVWCRAFGISFGHINLPLFDQK